MTLPTIKFNNATGSDTLASGYGPATAISGNGAATVAASAVVNLSANLPNLSTAAAGDVLAVNSSSGRIFSVIVTIDDTLDTITCEDTFSNTESSKNWGIGGKRKTIGNTFSARCFNNSNAKPGWIIQLEDNQTISAAVNATIAGDGTTGLATIQGNSAVTRPIITNSGNTAAFTLGSPTGGVLIKDLEFQNTSGTKTTAYAMLANNAGAYIISNCILGNATNKLGTGFFQSTGASFLTFFNTLITDCSINGIDISSAATLSVESCVIRNCVIGINHTGTTGSKRVRGNIIHGNSGDGLAFTTISNIEVVNNTIHGNGGDGLDLTTAGGTILRGYTIFNNNFTSNSGYGINATAIADAFKFIIDYNNYGSGGLVNTLGARNNVTAGANEIAVDPGYIDASNGNFAVTGAV